MFGPKVGQYVGRCSFNWYSGRWSIELQLQADDGLHHVRVRDFISADELAAWGKAAGLEIKSIRFGMDDKRCTFSFFVPSSTLPRRGRTLTRMLKSQCPTIRGAKVHWSYRISEMPG